MARTIKGKIKLDLKGVPRDKRQEAMEEVADALEFEILDYVGSGNSPVKGERAFKSLSPTYKKIKDQVAAPIPNLELTGEMLDDFQVKVKGNELEFGYFKDTASETSILKAENHNKWTSRANKTPVPKRRFIPKGDQGLKTPIMNRLKEIIEDYKNASEDN